MGSNIHITAGTGPERKSSATPNGEAGAGLRRPSRIIGDPAQGVSSRVNQDMTSPVRNTGNRDAGYIGENRVGGLPRAQRSVNPVQEPGRMNAVPGSVNERFPVTDKPKLDGSRLGILLQLVAPAINFSRNNTDDSALPTVGNEHHPDIRETDREGLIVEKDGSITLDAEAVALSDYPTTFSERMNQAVADLKSAPPKSASELRDFLGWLGAGAAGQAKDAFKRLDATADEHLVPGQRALLPTLKNWGYRMGDVINVAELVRLPSGDGLGIVTMQRPGEEPIRVVTFTNNPVIKAPWSDEAAPLRAYIPGSMPSSKFDAPGVTDFFIDGYRSHSGLGRLADALQALHLYEMKPADDIQSAEIRRAEKVVVEGLYGDMPYAKPEIVGRGVVETVDSLIGRMRYVDIEGRPGYSMQHTPVDPRVLFYENEFPWQEPLAPLFRGYEKALKALAWQQSGRGVRRDGRPEQREPSLDVLVEALNREVGIKSGRLRGMLQAGIPLGYAGPFVDSLIKTTIDTAAPIIAILNKKKWQDAVNELLRKQGMDYYRWYNHDRGPDIKYNGEYDFDGQLVWHPEPIQYSRW
jgi:hypothetical protein